MLSPLTNPSAVSALRVLTGTQTALTAIERQVSTGLRVAEASDDAAYWSIAVGMKSQVSALAATQDSLDLTGSIAAVTASALKGVIAMVQGIEKDVIAASEPGVDLDALQSSLVSKQRAISNIVNAASFNGVNWLVSPDAYSVSESAHLTNTYDNTSAYIQDMEFNAAPAATASSANVTLHIDDAIGVTGPNGYSASYAYDSGTQSWTQSRSIGSTSETVTNGVNGTQSYAISVPPNLPPISKVPLSYGSGGTLFGDVQDFSILKQITVVQTTGDDQVFTDRTDHYPTSGTVPLTSLGWAGDPAIVGNFISQAVPDSPLTDILNLDLTNTSQLGHAATAVTTALSSLARTAAEVGSLQAQIGIQRSFNASLSDALTSGVGSLVDADMNVASTRLQALQTQRQLGVQALSIANDNGAMILKLFG